MASGEARPITQNAAQPPVRPTRRAMARAAKAAATEPSIGSSSASR